MMILLTGIPKLMLWTIMCARCLWVRDNPITSLLTSLMYHDTPGAPQPRNPGIAISEINFISRHLDEFGVSRGGATLL